MRHLSLPRGYNDAERLHQRLQTEPESDWRRRGEQRALRLFHEMSQRVPAYKDFLKKHGIKSSDIKNIADFPKIPIIDKNNYLRAYPRADLCWDGIFAGRDWVISTTSGSTGEPFYFPRTDLQDQYLAITTELYLRGNFKIQDKTTLYIDAFPMGAWIGGVFTYDSIKQIAEKGYCVSIITPGIHKQEVINAVKQLGCDFDQIIIGAYAPFLKDILDDGTQQGINWTDYKIGFVFSAEAFTETFRDYIIQLVNAEDQLRVSLNHYGTVDLGTMAHETPLSILLRRQLARDDNLTILFPEDKRQPTFAQYDPSLFYFEKSDNSILCSSSSGLPLVRYDLKDYGGVLTKQQVEERMEMAGYDLKDLISQYAIEDTVRNLPFVYVYERNDFTVSYYAFLVYPDTIRRALQSEKFAADITGKFTMIVDYSSDGRQQLNIHIELRPGSEEKSSLARHIQACLHGALLQENSEYRETANMVGEMVKPIIKLWPYEDVTYFRAGTKQKWVVK